ncbi:MAG: HD domain-containing protein [Acidobacteriota bacterium]
MTTRIRDPIHGSIRLNEAERAILDSPHLQRLRNVRQLGFTDLAFPGATHSRHAHVVGACHVAGLALDEILERLSGFSDGDRRRLRAAGRVALLLHDIGHGPFSHTSEKLMPQRSALDLPAWLGEHPPERRASHEDYGLKMVLDSDLTDLLRKHYGPLDLPPEALAFLLSGKQGPGGPWFRVGGLDCGPLLRQLVSSDLDGDRMDYLLRDSFYTGVSHGQYDLEWLVEQLRACVRERRLELALRHRGLFTFEDYLLSRYHMFLSIYLHHTPVCFDYMLEQLVAARPGLLDLPSSIPEYLRWDDVTLLAALRDVDDDWAQRITWRRPFKLLLESAPYSEDERIDAARDRLSAAGIPHACTTSRGVIARPRVAGASQIWVLGPEPGRHRPLAEVTPLLSRYEGPVTIRRVHVEPERLDDARELISAPADEPPAPRRS